MTNTATPPLRTGDHLTRDEFERRWNAMPQLKRAELIEGIVYVGGPVPWAYGRSAAVLGGWLACYELHTPGLSAASNVSLRLDLDNEAQPHLVLRIPSEAGSASHISADDILEGAPELVIGVAASSASYDLHQKLGAYRRNGVPEYLVHRVEDGETDWFWLERGTYVHQQPDARGRLHSRVFPGLSLDVPALLRDDLAALKAVVDVAVATPEHAAFVARLGRVAR